MVEVEVQTEGKFNQALKQRIVEEIKEGIDGVKEVEFDRDRLIVRVETDRSGPELQKTLLELIRARFGHMVLPYPAPSEWDL